MTREEAKWILEEIKVMDDSVYQYDSKYLEALDIAIEALSAEPCIASASEWCRQHGYVMMPEAVYEQDMTKAYFEGQNIELCEDIISRQAAKKALEDRFMELQKRHSNDRYETNFCLNTILELPSVTQQPCNDCISRLDTLNVMSIMMDDATVGDGDNDTYETLDDLKQQYIEIVKGMSPVTPKQKTGHWITKIKPDLRSDMWPTNPKCSECGGEPYYYNTIYNYKFCPYCGAKIEVEQ